MAYHKKGASPKRTNPHSRNNTDVFSDSGVLISDGIKLSVEQDGTKALRHSIIRKYGLSDDQLGDIRIVKRSIDARKKDHIEIIYTVQAAKKGIPLPPADNYIQKQLKQPPTLRPIVVGSGPAGMLCALTLAQAGANPIILERGLCVEERTRAVENYFSGGELNTECNVQFGEGGAGTFSDGKLTTGIKNPRISHVNQIFIEAGAPVEIAYSAKPHIGTDRLRGVVRNIRRRIEELGGEYRFSTRLDDIIEKDGRLCAIHVTDKDGISSEIACECLVLATGHSARDTFEMLHKRGVSMMQKAFSVGVRIEHPQELIDRAQYGSFAGHKNLGAADYKLAVKTSDGRGVYTFCMCPGGHVVAAASESDSVVTNGMSFYARDGQNANSAVLVGITPEDFDNDHPLAGVEFQRRIERAAFKYTCCSKAPAQTLGDLLKNTPTQEFKSVIPSYRPGVVAGSISCCLPDFVVKDIAEGCQLFDRRIKGFAFPDAVLTAPETRSSSPVRIIRSEDLQSSIKGIYPCGEGAGYAGGIMSAAVDGIVCAEAIIDSYST